MREIGSSHVNIMRFSPTAARRGVIELILGNFGTVIWRDLRKHWLKMCVTQVTQMVHKMIPENLTLNKFLSRYNDIKDIVTHSSIVVYGSLVEGFTA